MWSARAKARQAKRRSAFYCSIDLAAPLAVVLVLMVIFMTNTQPHHQSYVDLAAANHATYQPHSRREDAMHVIMTRDGKLFFGTSAANIDDLPVQIRKAIRNGSESRLYLSVDGRARYAEVAVVVGQVRLAGVENITFLTEKQRAMSPPSVQIN
jgi:biopolymer transport protein ExbD